MRRAARVFALSLALVGTVVQAQQSPPPPPPTYQPYQPSQPAAEQQPSSGGSAFREAGAINDRSQHTRRLQISGFVTLPWYFFSGFPLGLGGRLYIPLVADGFIPPINDEFGLEVGLDANFLFGSFFGFAADLPAEAIWKFHITRSFQAYAKLGLLLGIGFGPYAFGYGGVTGSCFLTSSSASCVGFRIWPIGATGILYELSPKFHFRAEIGSIGLRVGLGFDL